MASIEDRVLGCGRGVYRARVRLRGHPSATATFSRKTDAKRWARQTETAILEGRYFSTREAQKHTVADLIDRYIVSVLPTKPKSASDQARQLAWWKERIGSVLLAEVTPGLLAECRDELARRITSKGTSLAPATVRLYMAPMSHAFSVAVREWGWIEENPFARVSKPRVGRGRTRFLSEEERVRLLEACEQVDPGDLSTAVVLALSTGGRKMEIMSLTWAQVDLGRGMISLEDTKNGERRSLALRGYALDLMKTRAKVRRIDTSLVFPGKKPQRPISLRKRWKKALGLAGVEDFRWHDLRHTAASYLAMNGATLAELAEFLGHKTLAMVKRYAHLTEGHTARVVESMNEKIFGGGNG